MNIITIVGPTQYFFTTDHCQRVRDDGVPAEFSGEEWVPVSCELPMRVYPRPGLENGIVDTIEKYVFIFLSDKTEIPNPNSKYIPDYRR